MHVLGDAESRSSVSTPYLVLFNRLTVKKAIICDSSLIGTLSILSSVFFHYYNDIKYLKAWLIISLLDPTLGAFIVCGLLRFLVQNQPMARTQYLLCGFENDADPKQLFINVCAKIAN